MAKIHEILSQKYGSETEKLHLRGSAAQTIGSIEKLDIPFCSLQSTEQIICPSQLCGVNIFWATSFFLSEGHPKLKFSRIFHKNLIFSETIGPINKP